ncbi:hypothetical protein ASC58_06000 [Phycicoccus sp. Root101]|nr:hypothetical protein ASC58_06000 [Phycicoccus sp. Root101]
MAGYGWVVVLVAGTGLVQVVTLVRVLGAATWGGVAFAQSASALASALVSLGWVTVGPSLIAMGDPPTRSVLFAQSLVTRTYAFVIVAPVLIAIVLLWAPDNGRELALLAVASLVPVMGASWYFVGQSAPNRLFLLDAVPQVAGVLAGLLVVAHAGVVGYALCVLGGNVVAVLLGIGAVGRDGPISLGPRAWGWRAAASYVGRNRNGLAASWAGSANSYLPMLMVGRWAASGLPPFAMSDRLFRYALTAFGPVVQFLQGWVPREAVLVYRRSRQALIGAMAVGTIAGGVIVFLGARLADVLSGGRVALDSTLLVPFGVAAGVLVVGQVTALVVLMPLGMSRVLAGSTLTGTAVLVAVAVVFGRNHGAVGIAWSMAAAEIVAVSWQVVAVLQRVNRQAVQVR